MKRSEMIAAIDNELCHRAVFESYVEPDGTWDTYKVAELILDRIELEGMPPPFCSEIYYKVWRDGGTGYQWEAE